MERRPSAPFEEGEAKTPTRRAFLLGAAAAGVTAAAGAFLSRSGSERKEEEETVNQRGLPPEEAVPQEPVLRIRYEIEKAHRLLSGDPLRFLESPYLVSALYYSDRFLGNMVTKKEESVPARQILQGIASSITPDLRKRYAEALTQDISIKGPQLRKGVYAPLPRLDFGRGNNHQDAVDIFAAEGTRVQAVRSGMVVLAEASWKKEDPFSTSSASGGNSVIIFSPHEKKFYRYCHLRDTSLMRGAFIEGGTPVGSVGATGLNASMPGHGGHLHLEINQCDEKTGRMRSLLAEEIKKELPGVQIAQK